MENAVVKYSKQFTHPFSTEQYWIGAEEPLREGETLIEAWNRIADMANEFHQQRFPDNKPIYKGEEELPEWKKASEVEDLNWLVVKQKLSDIEFREDAQEYIDTTEYGRMWEAKKIINLKPNKIQPCTQQSK